MPFIIGSGMSGFFGFLDLREPQPTRCQLHGRHACALPVRLLRRLLLAPCLEWPTARRVAPVKASKPRYGSSPTASRGPEAPPEAARPPYGSTPLRLPRRRPPGGPHATRPGNSGPP